ncbi:MAG: winged helix-turn-helix domain-containing protein [Candidatus Bathyarchaeota archaeon]|nr:winged helix-turn-helix domain-containing protein [Candidatus Bathyarchaeota archaeon]MDH5788167.1 winged helix-turn-helix domain-containing protein [Candidatus Bathyarchaeota archaeon]
MSNYEEDTYSTIFTSLKHPIRRKILRTLFESPRSFSDMQEEFRIESPHLTYHLENLGDLVFKNADGKYALLPLGKAATSMMYNVEEKPTKTFPHFTLPSKRWKVLSSILMIGLILISFFCFFQYQQLNQLSNQFTVLKAERELLLEALKKLGGLENYVLVYEHRRNMSITNLISLVNDSDVMTQYAHFVASVFPIYSLTSNVTLEIDISFADSLPSDAYLDISLLEPLSGNDGSRALSVIWWTRITGKTGYKCVIPSTGLWFISTSVRFMEVPLEPCETDYTVDLKIKSQEKNLPFLVLG